MNHECISALSSLNGDCDEIEKMLSISTFSDFIHPGERELVFRILAIAKEYHKMERFIENVHQSEFISIESQDLELAAKAVISRKRKKSRGPKAKYMNLQAGDVEYKPMEVVYMRDLKSKSYASVKSTASTTASSITLDEEGMAEGLAQMDMILEEAAEEEDEDEMKSLLMEEEEQQGEEEQEEEEDDFHSIKNAKSSSLSDNYFPTGVYLMAFCSGLRDVLQEYHETMRLLESQHLSAAQLGLPHTFSMTAKFLELFKSLNNIIATIQLEDIHGCLLIGRLHSYIDCGILPIENATKKILLQVNKMFYTQLSNWLVLGEVRDLYKEFFITDCGCDDNDFLYEWETQAVPEDSNRLKNFPKMKSHRVHKFAIRAHQLPSVIKPECAATILFVGRLVWIMRHDPRSNPMINGKLDPKRDIWHGETTKHIRAIQQMEKESFDRSRFEKLVEEYRRLTSRYLWNIMVDQVQLVKQLQLIRDYYCLGRGELFQHFIVAVDAQLPEIPVGFVMKNLNYIFVETARTMYSSHDESYLKFELLMPCNMNMDEFMLNPLAYIELYFDVKWPLHIIFRPRIITLLNKVFNFLLRVKKTHIDLHRLWRRHMLMKTKIDETIWSLRHSLIFLVNNIQYYLQVDIIEAQFSTLISKIRDATDYTDIVRMHSIFISDLLSHTFVITIDDDASYKLSDTLHYLQNLDCEARPKVYNIIMCLLELCDSFCLLANATTDSLKSSEHEQLAEIQSNLDAILENLFRALHSLHERVSGSHLLQLLHRLDFNRWYTKKNKLDLNLSMMH